MNFVSYIPCRLGEPITALDIADGHLAFGSIIGYYGVYSFENDELRYGKECLNELVRAIKIFHGKLYMTNGDENITVVSLDNLDEIKTTIYPDLQFKHEVCSNYMSAFYEDKKKDVLQSLLIFAPTHRNRAQQ
jgi:hypothetical protein